MGVARLTLAEGRSLLQVRTPLERPAIPPRESAGSNDPTTRRTRDRRPENVLTERADVGAAQLSEESAIWIQLTKDADEKGATFINRVALPLLHPHTRQ